MVIKVLAIFFENLLIIFGRTRFCVDFSIDTLPQSDSDLKQYMSERQNNKQVFFGRMSFRNFRQIPKCEKLDDVSSYNIQ